MSETDLPPNSRLFAAVFCPHCQFSLLADPQPVTCPKCGVSIALDIAAELETRVMPRSAERVMPRASMATEVDVLIGQRFNRYLCRGLLGAGAMGRVYLARHVDLHRNCALKVLPPTLVGRDAGYVDRFVNEGRAAAALNHPNIVTVHAIGEDRGFHFLEMEFVAGQSLRKLVEDFGPQDPIRATSLTLRIADGLAAAHMAGILHRDLKPDNVMLTHLGVPKITDFGLAKRVILDADDESAQEVVGTPPYMAPELFQQREATPASDVYALGVVYFFLLTGQVPFHSAVLSRLMHQVQHDAVPSLRKLVPGLPLEMSECLLQMLSKAADNRPRSAVEAAQLLAAVLGESEDLEQLMQSAFAHQSGLIWRKVGQTFEVDVKMSDGRKQTVRVEPSARAAVDRTLRISSICCPARADYFEAALRLNSEILHGAMAIAEIEEKPMFVMVDNYPRGTVDAEEIRRSVLDVAQRADAVEKLLTGMDHY